MTRDLSRDHVKPVARGGRDSWTNTVTACRRCNTRKGSRSPEQAGMPLLYVPYVPDRHEHFILRNRRILADQMEYLLAGVPKSSPYLSDPLVGVRLPEVTAQARPADLTYRVSQAAMTLVPTTLSNRSLPRTARESSSHAASVSRQARVDPFLMPIISRP